MRAGTPEGLVLTKYPMKATLFLGLSVVLCASFAQAEQSHVYPKKNPLVTFTVPDDWKAEVKHDSLFVVSPDGGDVIVEVSMMEAAIDDDAAAVKEARSTVDQDFKKLNLTKSDPAKANGLVVTLLGGEGIDDSGPAHINMALIKHPEAETQVLFSLIASKDKAAKHGAACGAMLNSISAAAPGKAMGGKTKAPAASAHAYSYPEGKPLIDLTIPADWQAKFKSGALFTNPKDDSSYFISITPMKTSSADPAAAVKEAKDQTEELFKNVKYQETQKTEGGGVEILLINAKGEDQEGKANINLWIVGQEGQDTLLLVKCISSQEAFEKHGEAGLELIRSIKAHGKGGSVQTYSYPDKKKPSFVMELPSDWNLEADANGAFVVSADKLFTLNIIPIDVEHINEAMVSIMKKVSAKYESVVWNDGGDPKVNIDEATGNTLVANEGVGKGKGVEHKLSVYQFAKKGSDKFFVISAWAPMKEADTNGEAALKMLSSIKLN
jgi:hypothetical protein